MNNTIPQNIIARIEDMDMSSCDDDLCFLDDIDEWSQCDARATEKDWDSTVWEPMEDGLIYCSE